MRQRVCSFDKTKGAGMSKAKAKRSEIITFRIKNWSKYQIRKELKSMHYFRVQNDIFYDAKFSSLTLMGKLCWFLFMHEATRQYHGEDTTKNDGQVEINVSSFAHQHNINARWVRCAISDLEQLQMVVDVCRHENVPRVEKSRVEKNRVEKSREEKTESGDSTPTKQIAAQHSNSHWLVDLWNQFGAKLPKAQTTISSARLKKIQTRIKDQPDQEVWKQAIIRLAESNFANGLNDRAWVAGFDFILQSEALDKILEGKYDNRRSITKQEAHYRQQMQAIENGEL
jgi:hypothetical protein